MNSIKIKLRTAIFKMSVPLCIGIFFLCSNNLHAQLNVLPDERVLIGENSLPQSSAKLAVNSSTQGLLIPRMSEMQMNGIVNPADGLLVYVAEEDDMKRGFYYFDIMQGTEGDWVKLFGNCDP